MKIKQIQRQLGWWWNARPRPLLSIRFAIQRATRGYSDHDAMSFDTWHAEVVANLCEDYIKRDFGNPCFGREPVKDQWPPCQFCDCNDEWIRILSVMRDGYRMIATGNDEMDDYITIKPEVLEAERLFAEHYRTLWL